MTKQSSQRILYTGSIVWLMGFGLLAAACISIAMSLPMPSRDVSGVLAWVQQHQTALQMADEMLACGASMLLAIVVVLHSKHRERHPVGMSVVLALGIVVAIGAFYAMMSLGRLVYPVNGITDYLRNKRIIGESTVCGAALDGIGNGCMCYCGSNYYEISADHPNEHVCCTTKSRRYILYGRSFGTIDGSVRSSVIWLVYYDSCVGIL